MISSLNCPSISGGVHHTYDGWRETEELEVVSISGQNQLVARKAFAWGHRLDELLTYVRRDVNGETVTHTPFYAHQAGADATSLLVQSDGTKVEEYEYDTFGRPSVYVGSSYSGPSSTVGNPYSWHGKRFDIETGLFYSRYRYYSPDFGRFLNIDPLGVWADLLNVGNGYTYGANSPLNYLDPYGLQGLPAGLPQALSQGMSNLPPDPSLLGASFGIGHAQDGAGNSLVQIGGAAGPVLGFAAPPKPPKLPNTILGRIALAAHPWVWYGASELTESLVPLGPLVKSAKAIKCVAKGGAAISRGRWTLGGHKTAAKWANQMKKRGWTSKQIDEAIAGGNRFPAENLVNPGNRATRYVHPNTGRSVVVDDVSGEIIHIGGDGFRY